MLPALFRRTPLPASPWPVTVYYDGACTLCNTEMTNLMLRNTRGLLRFVDCSQPGFNAGPPGVDPRELMRVLHAQTANGTLVLGIPAFELAYAGAGLNLIAGLLGAPVLHPIAVWLYPFVADNRERFPKWLARVMFGTAVRRAAERAAVQQCGDGRCHVAPAPVDSTSQPF